MKFNQIVLVVLVFEMIAITQPDPVLCSVQFSGGVSSVKSSYFSSTKRSNMGFFWG